jgi:pimeloyl-ACP methyl ester carboxylesterase
VSSLPSGEISFERRGAGAPLLLLHGTGYTREAWTPVRDALARHHELLLVDLPGHGRSPPPPDFVAPAPSGYAHLIAVWLDEQGLDRVHVAGHSIGGWIGLELAKESRAESVVALAPAGLWRRKDPVARVAKLWVNRRVLTGLWPVVPLALRPALGRRIFLRDPFAHPESLDPEVAVAFSRAYRDTQGFDAHLAAVRHARFRDGRAIDVPVTVAFGEHERLLTARKAQSRDELPAQTRWLTLPGCGHVMTYDDPDLVAHTILEVTAG